jgi:hypothetical protein
LARPLRGDLDSKKIRIRSVARLVCRLVRTQKRLPARALCRKSHAFVPKEVFGPSMSENVVVRSTALRPTMGFEMILVKESKAFCNAINGKRTAVVRALVKG